MSNTNASVSESLQKCLAISDDEYKESLESLINQQPIFPEKQEITWEEFQELQKFLSLLSQDKENN